MATHSSILAWEILSILHTLVYRWGNNETVTDFIFFGSKITADADCTHEIKKHLLLG